MQTHCAALGRERAISQLEWSRRSGVPQSNISAYEAGRRLPRPETVERLLAALVERASIVLGRHRDEVIELAHRNHLGTVRVFGSVQRGTDRVGSDIDLLVTPAKGASAIAMTGFMLDVEDLTRSRVDVVSDRGTSPVLDAIRAQAVVL